MLSMNWTVRLKNVFGEDELSFPVYDVYDEYNWQNYRWALSHNYPENDIFRNTHIFVIFSHHNKENALFKASTLKQFDIVLFYEGVGVQLQRESWDKHWMPASGVSSSLSLMFVSSWPVQSREKTTDEPPKITYKSHSHAKHWQL